MISNFERKRVPEHWTQDTKTPRAHFNCSSSRHHKVTAGGRQTCGLGEAEWPLPSTATQSNRMGHCREDIWRRGCRVWIRFFGEHIDYKNSQYNNRPEKLIELIIVFRGLFWDLQFSTFSSHPFLSSFPSWLLSSPSFPSSYPSHSCSPFCWLDR